MRTALSRSLPHGSELTDLRHSYILTSPEDDGPAWPPTTNRGLPSWDGHGSDNAMRRESEAILGS